MRKPLRRAEILEESGLRFAPVEAQRAFWRDYNLSRRRRVTRLGDLASKLVEERAVVQAARLERVRQAWISVAPARFAEAAQVDALRGGVLVLRTEGASAKFALARQIGDVLLQAMRELLPDLRLDRIECRIAGSAARNPWARPAGDDEPK